MTFYLIWTGLCSVFGYSAFIAFLILKNYSSAVLGVLSGTTDAVTFFLIFLKRKRSLQLWYDQHALRKICRLGVVVASLGLLNLGYHITIQIMKKAPMLPVADSQVICIVWSFILMRSGLVLMYHAIVFQRNEDIGLLTESNRDNEEEGINGAVSNVPSSS